MASLLPEAAPETNTTAMTAMTQEIFQVNASLSLASQKIPIATIIAAAAISLSLPHPVHR